MAVDWRLLSLKKNPMQMTSKTLFFVTLNIWFRFSFSSF